VPNDAVRVLFQGDREFIPEYKSLHSAGADLKAAVKTEVIVPPGNRVLIPAGFRMALPPGWEAQVRPRSGLAIKHGITILNSPGTIDSDYRGDVAVILVNLGQEDFTIYPGDRIAQMVIASVDQGQFIAVQELPVSERGEGGFGSTGHR